MEASTNTLLHALATDKQITIPGIFDPLSAKIAEIMGFPAAWVSGFCVSTSFFMPDENYMTVDQYINRLSEIRRIATIPLIVDCDEGYGDMINTLYLLQNLAKLDIQAICIEDNAFPKINSFKEPNGTRHALESVESFCHKLYNIKRNFPELILIARTESMIVGEPLESAIIRGKAYKSAGADFLVIHSKNKRLSEFKLIVDAWEDPDSLVVIPTLAEDLSFMDLKQIGFRIIILANQVLRSGIHAMCSAYGKIKADAGINELNKDTVPMKFIFDLIDNHYKKEALCSISK
ncbi:isocitrate lyase/PEP mutase family protein [Puia dinghuensis]|uniref:Phosphoenolpyruvate phosphomutase n=1 Tax=Puia dinghuensis TaxID=1792502 RepID=A0A8J2UB80_9BACT|nr:isocitrate lyase/PEP mutase family protein [Puia dinghuensis]GGA93302.1 hypothetical protein GCM10011511_15890 [Puia dinghuensis]